MSFFRSLLCIMRLLLLTSFCFVQAFGRPLTEDDIRNAQQIGIMPGSFDPVTNGHVKTAEASVTEGGLDLTIMLPINNPLKNPLPVPTRLEMIDLATSQSSQVFYPKTGELGEKYLNESLGRWIGGLRRINPDLKIYVVVGSDISSSNLRALLSYIMIHPDGWIVASRTADDIAHISTLFKLEPYKILKTPPAPEVSSTLVKTFLKKIYNSGGPADVNAKVPDIDEKVAKFIIQNRFYSGDVSTSVEQNMVHCLLRALHLEH